MTNENLANSWQPENEWKQEGGGGGRGVLLDDGWKNSGVIRRYIEDWMSRVGGGGGWKEWEGGMKDEVAVSLQGMRN